MLLLFCLEKKAIPLKKASLLGEEYSYKVKESYLNVSPVKSVRSQDRIESLKFLLKSLEHLEFLLGKCQHPRTEVLPL